MVVRIYTRTMHEVTRFPAMAVIDADKGTLITTVGICSGPAAAAHDPALKLVFASRGGRTMSLGPLTHSVYQMARVRSRAHHADDEWPLGAGALLI